MDLLHHHHHHLNWLCCQMIELESTELERTWRSGTSWWIEGRDRSWVRLRPWGRYRSSSDGSCSGLSRRASRHWSSWRRCSRLRPSPRSGSNPTRWTRMRSWHPSCASPWESETRKTRGDPRTRTAQRWRSESTAGAARRCSWVRRPWDPDRSGSRAYVQCGDEWSRRLPHMP